MKKGVSLITLIITVIILATLITTVTISGFAMYNNSLKTSLASELSIIKLAVDNYYDKTGEYPANRSVQVDLSLVSENSKSQFLSENIVDNKIVLQEIDYNILNLKSLKYGLGTNGDNDIYAVSETTGIVYYVKGVTIGNYTYYTLDEELENLTTYEYLNAVTDNEDGIIFYPSDITWTNENISVEVKVPKTVVVTSVLNNAVEVSNNVLDNTDEYYVYSIEDIDSNRDITVNYTVNGESKIASYTVNNIDKVSPTLTVEDNQEIMVSNNDKYAYSMIDVSDDLSDIKVLKYENEIIGDNSDEGILAIETYFETAGTTLYTDMLTIEPNVENITVYAEDSSGNWTVKYVEVEIQVFIILSDIYSVLEKQLSTMDNVSINDNIIYGDDIIQKVSNVEEDILEKIGIIGNEIYYIADESDSIYYNALSSLGYIVVDMEDFEYIAELKIIENLVKYINDNNLEEVGKQIETTEYENSVTISGSVYGIGWTILGDEDLEQVITQIETGGQYTLSDKEKALITHYPYIVDYELEAVQSVVGKIMYQGTDNEAWKYTFN